MMKIKFAIEQPINLYQFSSLKMYDHAKTVLKEYDYLAAEINNHLIIFEPDLTQISNTISITQPALHIYDGKIEIIEEKNKTVIRLFYSVSYIGEITMLICTIAIGVFVNKFAFAFLIVIILRSLYRFDKIGRMCDEILSKLIDIKGR